MESQKKIKYLSNDENKNFIKKVKKYQIRKIVENFDIYIKNNKTLRDLAVDYNLPIYLGF